MCGMSPVAARGSNVLMETCVANRFTPLHRVMKSSTITIRGAMMSSFRPGVDRNGRSAGHSSLHHSEQTADREAVWALRGILVEPSVASFKKAPQAPILFSQRGEAADRM